MIAVLSDIHGNLEALNVVIDKIKELNIDQIYVLGDIIDYGADSVSVINRLHDLKYKDKCKLVCILGNHENSILYGTSGMINTPHGKQSSEITRKEVCQDEVMEKLDDIVLDTYEIELSDHFHLFHGSPCNPLNGMPCSVEGSKLDVNKKFWAWTKKYVSEIRLGGHTHVQGYNLCYEHNLIYINPGSVGQPRNGDPRTQFAVIKDYDEEYTTMSSVIFYRLKYDIDTAAKKIIDSGRPEFLAQRLYLGI